jgi:hypothetical protein
MGVVVRRARSAWTREERLDSEEQLDIPAALRADGSMVPDGSMMPFPMPPFDMDMVWTGCACTEYIPWGAGAAELAGQSGERRVVEQLRWEPMGAGRYDSRTAGAGGAFGGGRRWWSNVGCRSSVAKGRCRVCCDGRALQDPEVPAGGAKQRTGLLDW